MGRLVSMREFKVEKKAGQGAVNEVDCREGNLGRGIEEVCVC